MIRLAFYLLVIVFPAVSAVGQADDGRWLAGGYSFSDESGGFRILSATGRGTRADPVVLVEELTSASPTTLVIRSVRPIQPFALGGDFANGFLTMEIHAINRSGLGWIAFEYELQEQRGLPSTYGDGLSFDQRSIDSETTNCDVFARFSRQFEPGDRIIFDHGALDADKVGTFRFFITDFTPVAIFYLVQDPRIPYS